MSTTLRWTNWSKSFITTPSAIYQPSSEKEIIEIIQKAGIENKVVKAVGSGHSCSLIGSVDNGYLLDLQSKYQGVINFDKKTRQLTVKSGTSLRQIADFALANNCAIDNLGTIVDQSISGAISTGTHGSGITHGAVDQSILTLSIVTAEGKIRIFDKRTNTEEFHLAVVSIGALGIISTITIQLVANFNMKITTKSLSFDEMIEYLPKAYTDDYCRFWWAPHTDRVQYWEAHKTSDKADKPSSWNFYVNDLLKGNFLHELGLWITSFVPKQIPTLNKLMFNLLLSKEKTAVTNFLDGFTLPILVKQKVMEYAIPIEHTSIVLQEIKEVLQNKKYLVHMPIEVRFTPKNEAALSMSHGRKSCYIGIIAYKPFGKDINYDAYFEDIHNIYTKYEGRPHWAKVTYYSKEELSNLYPNWNQFDKLRAKMDPEGRFLNKYLSTYFN